MSIPLFGGLEIVLRLLRGPGKQMAFIYPFHAPSLPSRWDDPLWFHEVCPSMEHSLLATLEQKRMNQRAKDEMRYINDGSCGLRADDMDEEEEDSGDDH
ncbi:hypothetical protein ANCDUO_08373 [Ancylostoma duodenale]|uniref:Uncharacterized protein n=1 Tax=Ancylostoma duodenale TaxID=51022 RepID=A0A0C2GQK2_9BILA|nr:hypothetical protein ANCDUO_08373 [Ancylostoma duodenale]